MHYALAAHGIASPWIVVLGVLDIFHGNDAGGADIHAGAAADTLFCRVKKGWGNFPVNTAAGKPDGFSANHFPAYANALAAQYAEIIALLKPGLLAARTPLPAP